jgi:hypothetical protein
VTGLGFPDVAGDGVRRGPPAALAGDLPRDFFNGKVPVGVDKSYVTEDQGGRMRDQYGRRREGRDRPCDGITRYVIYMPMIEASTRYLGACRRSVRRGEVSEA